MTMKLLRWAARYNKAFVALGMCGLYFVNRNYGVDIPLSEESLMIIWSAIVSLMTYLVPNKTDA